MLAKLQRQRKRQKNIYRFNLPKNNLARVVHFFVHLFAVVLQDYNGKLQETS